MTITVSINNQTLELPPACSLETALQAAGHSNFKHFAVAVNKTFIPKSRYTETLLQTGDCIDVLAPMQGG